MSRINLKYCAAILTITTTFLQMGLAYEFDARALDALGFGEVDLSAFSGENPVNSGEYESKIYINNDLVLRDAEIFFYDLNGQNDVCIIGSVMNNLPLKNAYYIDLESSTEATEEVCYGIAQISSDIKVDFDPNNHELRLTVPQVFLLPYDPQWVKPSDRDSGISGVILDYTILQNYSKYKGVGGSNKGTVSYGTVGANLGSIRFRSHYQYNRNKSNHYKSSDFTWTQTYAFMDLAQFSAKIYAGEMYSRGNTFSSVRFKGLSLYTDESMMPSFMKGYAPQVSGIALTDATITISQNNRIIRAIQVPAGPFEIADLPAYLRGVIQVKIEESDGSIKSYETEVSQVPFLTRKGDIRYFINAGKLSPLKYRGGSKAPLTSSYTSSEFSYGLTNRVSVFGGLTTISSKYQAVNLGIGVDFGFWGAISADITRSHAKFDNQQLQEINNSIFYDDSNSPLKNSMKGVAYKFNYAKRLTTNANLNIIGYRFSTKEYMSVDNYIQSRSSLSSVARDKNRITAIFSYQFVDSNSNITASFERSSYWNRKSGTNYNIGYNKYLDKGPFKNTSLSVMGQRRHYDNGRKENMISMYVSIPMGEDYSKIARYNAIYSDLNKTWDQRASLYSREEWGNYQVGIESNSRRTSRSDYSLTSSVAVDSQYGDFRSNFREGRDNRYISVEFNGSITATANGVVAHKQVYNDGSRLILDTGAPGVKLESYSDVTSNYFGKMGISNVSDYYYNQYILDNDNMPENVDIQDSVIDIAVTKGAIAYRNLNGVIGAKAIATIALKDGSHPPFGAQVTRENGKDSEVGLVAQNGLVYLTGLNSSARYLVTWNDNSQSCYIKMPASFDTTEIHNLTCYTE